MRPQTQGARGHGRLGEAGRALPCSLRRARGHADTQDGDRGASAALSPSSRPCGSGPGGRTHVFRVLPARVTRVGTGAVWFHSCVHATDADLRVKVFA